MEPSYHKFHVRATNCKIYRGGAVLSAPAPSTRLPQTCPGFAVRTHRAAAQPHPEKHGKHRVSSSLFSIHYFAENSSVFLQNIVSRFPWAVNLISILYVKLMEFSEYFDGFHIFFSSQLLRYHKDFVRKSAGKRSPLCKCLTDSEHGM